MSRINLCGENICDGISSDRGYLKSRGLSARILNTAESRAAREDRVLALSAESIYEREE